MHSRLYLVGCYRLIAYHEWLEFFIRDRQYFLSEFDNLSATRIPAMLL